MEAAQTPQKAVTFWDSHHWSLRRAAVSLRPVKGFQELQMHRKICDLVKRNRIPEAEEREKRRNSDCPKPFLLQAGWAAAHGLGALPVLPAHTR